MLEKPEWKYDYVPEIMDGKNIADFVDEDIAERLEELEREEEMLGHNEEEIEEEPNEEELLLMKTREDIFKKKKFLKEAHKLRANDTMNLHRPSLK